MTNICISVKFPLLIIPILSVSSLLLMNLCCCSLWCTQRLSKCLRLIKMVIRWPLHIFRWSITGWWVHCLLRPLLFSWLQSTLNRLLRVYCLWLQAYWAGRCPLISFVTGLLARSDLISTKEITRLLLVIKKHFGWGEILRRWSCCCVRCVSLRTLIFIFSQRRVSILLPLQITSMLSRMRSIKASINCIFKWRRLY